MTSRVQGCAATWADAFDDVVIVTVFGRGCGFCNGRHWFRFSDWFRFDHRCGNLEHGFWRSNFSNGWNFNHRFRCWSFNDCCNYNWLGFRRSDFSHDWSFDDRLGFHYWSDGNWFGCWSFDHWRGDFSDRSFDDRSGLNHWRWSLFNWTRDECLRCSFNNRFGSGSTGRNPTFDF